MAEATVAAIIALGRRAVLLQADLLNEAQTRALVPQDIADSVCFLAQAGAITGTTLIADGGQHLIPALHDAPMLKP